ncbi:MAG: SgcJ/EcaC family oxidoreductase [Rhodobacteraceae bacterium]|nr:SgcJ/EcaC family oxidoreductase [Paracoccaceae bacterium]
MRKHLAVAATAALLGAGAALADQGPIAEAQRSWETAFNGGDGAAAAAAVFTEDARLLPPGEPMVEGREAIGKYWQGAMDAGVHGLDLNLIAVEMQGDTMIETGTWSVLVPGENGGETRVGGKSLVIWKKQADGVWRMSQDMWNNGQ